MQAKRPKGTHSLYQMKTKANFRRGIYPSHVIILTVPIRVSVSTKYVTADFDHSNSRTPSITVAVEDGCCPAICLSTPTSDKLAASGTREDWVQKGF